MAKVKVKDNRGHAKKKARIAQFGKQTKVQKVGANKLIPAAPAMPAHVKTAMKRQQQQKKQQQASRTGSVGGTGDKDCGSGVSDSKQGSGHNPFAKDQDLSMLLLGEGDFSFGAALVMLWGEAPKLTASGLQAEAEVLSYEGAEDNVETIKAFGGKVCFGVDATKLRKVEALGRKKGRGFARIVFNFPQVEGGSREAGKAIKENQALLRALFSNVADGDLLADGGLLKVTLPKGEPYSSWNMITLAKLAGLRVRNCTPFDVGAIPGYNTATASQAARCYAFEKLPPREEPEVVKKKFNGDVKEAKKQRSKKARRP